MQEYLTFSECHVSDESFGHSSSLTLHTVQESKQIMEWYTRTHKTTRQFATNKYKIKQLLSSLH